MRGCTEVLSQLKSLLTRYRSLGTENKRAWDRARFSSDDVHACRNNILVHASSLTLSLTRLGTGSLGRFEKKFDDLATDIRTGQHDPSMIGMCDDPSGQDDAWRILLSELSEDFTRVEVEKHKEEIKRYTISLRHRGALPD